MESRRSTSSKTAPKLETCPLCYSSDSVECSIDLKLRVAEAVCCICEGSFSTKAHALTEPIDVYSEWIDECDTANHGGVQDMDLD